MNKANILFIGGGNMGRAIISGLIKQGYDPHCIYVVDPNLEKRQQLLESYQLHVSANLEEFLPLADVIFLAVKPQDAKDLCVLIGKQLKNRSVLVISIMAGINLSSLNQCLGHDLAIVRAMPNTPAIIQAGATGLFANAQALAEHKVQAESILKAVGMTAWLNKEEDIDSITALSGSGPAYYFYFMELMQDIAIEMGIPFETAKAFAVQTAYGAAKLALESAEDFSKLRHQVTSKGGTTEAALKLMQEKNIADIFAEAMEACRKRAKQLSQN